jgi:inorganic pyrophosphatase
MRMEVKPIGVFMADDKGPDEKVICVQYLIQYGIH